MSDPIGDAARHEHRKAEAGEALSDMARLATSFPTLQGRPGTSPWDATVFARHVEHQVGGMGVGARQAAAFVLYVWNPRDQWDLPEFDLARALGTWDLQHRAAWQAWAREPWFA